jgi:cation diffusion facilitator CzcD-associated flavoprotein CzcO
MANSGAGPSGLVAAKSLLHDVPSGTFDVTIFDSQPRVGGLWPSSKAEAAGLLHPLMVANQSKHTMQFSDLAWEEAGPEFPRAWQVGRYLHRYFQMYCQGAKLRLATRVESAEPLPAPGHGWRLNICNDDAGPEEHTFDFLLVASGIFARSFTPPVVAENPAIPVLHSSQYRDLPSLLRSARPDGGKILVVGGQMSGVEIAGTIAAHISSAIHTPGASSIPNADRYHVHHVSPLPTWVFPLFTSPQVRLGVCSSPSLRIDMVMFVL